MKLKYLGVIFAISGLGISGCATSPKKGSPEAGQQLLKDDQAAVNKADANYKDNVLKHGEPSREAVKAKAELDNAKNKLAADEVHVQQLQTIDGASTSTTPMGAQGSGKGTTTTTTVTTTP